MNRDAAYLYSSKHETFIIRITSNESMEFLNFLWENIEYLQYGGGDVLTFRLQS